MLFRNAHFSALVSLGVVLLAPSTSALAQPPTAFVRGRVLVRFKTDVSSNQVNAVLNAFQARTAGEIPQLRIHIVQLPANASETAFRNAFRQRAEVEFAELDHIRQHEEIVPNDPAYSSEWHLGRIAAPTAWSTTTGSTSVIVAIADTGVDSTNPDLSTKVVAGWNMTDNNSNTQDVYGHGTKVAGTVAAATNNGFGVASVAWNCWIMPVRVSLTNGSAYDSTIASGITWAADHGARVVNVSYQVTGSSTVSAAAKYFYNKGGVVTVSAGNYSTFDSIPEDPYMLTVGGTDPNDVLYSWSDTGTDIDLVAPGCVTTTFSGGGYGGACGTSFSAPVVAGVAALVMSENPGLTPAQVTSILQNSADDLGTAGWDSTFGWGRVNAARAVSMAAGTISSAPPPDTQAPTVSIASPAAGAVLSGTATINVSATDNVGVAAVTLAVNGTTIGSDTAAPYTFTWNTSTVGNGSYTLVASARDAANNTASTSVTVTVNNTADTTAPTISITSPAAGSTVGGNATLAAAASDNAGVVKVQYYCDGALIATATTAPFSAKWNTRKVAPGAHSLQAKAYDAAGNVGTSATVSVVTR